MMEVEMTMMTKKRTRVATGSRMSTVTGVLSIMVKKTAKKKSRSTMSAQIHQMMMTRKSSRERKLSELGSSDNRKLKKRRQLVKKRRREQRMQGSPTSIAISKNRHRKQRQKLRASRRLQSVYLTVHRVQYRSHLSVLNAME